MADVDYGVRVENKFALIGDDENDPNELLAQQLSQLEQPKKKEEVKKKKPAIPTTGTNKINTIDAKKPTTAPVQKPTAPAARTTPDSKPRAQTREGNPQGQQQTGGRGRGAPRGGPRPQMQDRPPRFGGPMTGSEEINQDSDPGFQQREGGGFIRGRGRGGMGMTFTRGGRGGRGGGRGGSGGVGFPDQSQLHDEKAQRGFNDRPYHRDPAQVNESFPNEAAIDDAPRGDDYGYGDEGRGGDYRARTSRGNGGYGGRSGRGFYAGTGGRGGFGQRGRRFDRISGSDQTGVKQVDKRDGGGKFNWGGPKDELAGENEGMNATVQSADEMAPGAEVEGAEGGKQEEQADGNAPAKEEEAQRELTLDEWKALQGPKNKPAFNIRKPGEGERDKTEKLKLIHKPKEAEKGEEADEGYEEEEDAHHKKKKELLIDVTFADSGRGAGGGGRGGGRGMGRGRGRGGGGGRGRGGGPEGEDQPRRFGGNEGGFGNAPAEDGRRNKQREFKVDEESFPQLGAA